MAQMTLTQDLDLCRKILLRTEEVLACDGPKGPSNYTFSGYSSDKVGYNVEALHHEGFIEARIPSERTGQWTCWPVGLTEKGQVILDAVRSEKGWKESLEQMKVRGKNQNLKTLDNVLLEGAMVSA